MPGLAVLLVHNEAGFYSYKERESTVVRLRHGLILLVAMFVCRCGSKPVAPTPLRARGQAAEAPLGAVSIAFENPPPASMLKVPAADLPNYVRSLYRLEPDRRFLYAVAEVDRILSGHGHGGVIFLRFQDGVWKIRWNDREVGSLPEIPTYADESALLDRWCRQILAAHPLRPPAGHSDLASLGTSLRSGSSDEVLAALEGLNLLWKKTPYDPDLIRAAAQGFAWLSVQTFDHLDLSAPLLGRALALVMISKAIGKEDLAADEALLCDHLGYEAAAMDISKRLPAEDPVRLYVNAEWEMLRRTAEADRGERRGQYLYLLHLANEGHRQSWWDWLDRSSFAKKFNPSVLAATAQIGDITTQEEACAAWASAVWFEAEEPRGATIHVDASSLEQAIGDYWEHLPARFREAESHSGEFESAVLKRAQTAGGDLLDADSIEAMFRARFYTALYMRGFFYLRVLSSNESAAEYLKQFRDPPPGAPSELHSWIGAEVEFMRTGAPSALTRVLPTLRHIGGRLPSSWIDPIVRSTHWQASPIARAAVRFCFERMDTRPAYLYAASYDAEYPLDDPSLQRLYTRATFQEAPQMAERFRVRVALQDGDFAELRKIAMDPAEPPSVRSDALWYLHQRKHVERDFLTARYEDLVRQFPDSGALEAANGIFSEAGWWSDMARINQTWLEARKIKEEDLRWAYAQSRLAEAYERMGELGKAWSTIEPAMRTWKEDALTRGASIRAAQGKLDEALEIGRATFKRYSDGRDSAATLAALLWRTGSYEEAATVLATPSVVRVLNWESVGSALARLAAANPSAAEAAFAAMSRRGLSSPGLIIAAERVGSSEQHDLAFRLLRGLKTQNYESVKARLAAYFQCREARGKEKALEYLRGTGPFDLDFALSLFNKTLETEDAATRAQFFGLLWETSDPDPNKEGLLQLMRAAALLHMHAHSDSRRDALIEYFNGRPADDELADLGKYLLGETSAEPVLARPTNLKSICGRGWTMGVKAASEGRVRDAAAWFQVTLETGQYLIPPDVWALNILSTWVNSGPFRDRSDHTNAL
jgi:hypothetical protein